MWCKSYLCFIKWYSFVALCCTMLHMDKYLIFFFKFLRVLVLVNVYIFEVFKWLVKVGNFLIGSVIVEWFDDMVEVVEFMVVILECVWVVFKVVTAEFHAMMLGMVD